MSKYFSNRFQPTLTILLLSLTSVIVLFLLESHVGLTIWDEGYLWYGAQRVMLGEVPIRDFLSYDIGRYYWSAAFMSVLGSNGIVALRVAIAAFQVVTLYIGLTALARISAKQNPLFWLLAVITLLIWMAPQFRVFDIALPIILVGTLSFLVEQPTTRRYFLTGLIIGLAAIFGRNHGVYGVIGSLGVIAYLATRREGGTNLMTAFMCWLLGIVVGYLPMVIFIVVVPGFAQAFWESIRFLFEVKATNIPLPVAWPWLLPFKQMSIVEMMRGLTFGMSYIAIIGFGLLGIVWAIRKKLIGESVSALLVASIFLTLPYAHYAYSRADIAHLAPGIPPFLMGILALLATQSTNIKRSLLLTLLLIGASLLLMLPVRYIWECSATLKCVETNIVGDRLKIDQKVVNNLAILTKLSDKYSPEDRTFLVAPFWPGAYAALEKKAPMWEIFAFYPRSTSFQQAEIERIKAANPGFVVINDFALDERDDLRFRNTHPIIDQYIRGNFVQLNLDNSEIRIYKSK